MPNVTLHGPDDVSPGRPDHPIAQPVTPPKRPGVDHVTDDRGRILTVRTAGPRERMRLFKAIGPENSRNEPYVGTATLAYCVSEIDGDPVPVPANEVQIEALVERLGDDGINAVAQVMMERMGITEADIEAAGGNPTVAAQMAAERKKREVVATAKNSREMPNS